MSSRKRRVNWSPEDVKAMESAFQVVLGADKPWPTLKAIRKIFTTSPKVSHIFKREDTDEHRQRCMDKIKSLYRMKRKATVKKIKKE